MILLELSATFLVDFFTTDIEIDNTGFARKTEYYDIAMLAKIGGIVEHVDRSRIFLATTDVEIRHLSLTQGLTCDT